MSRIKKVIKDLGLGKGSIFIDIGAGIGEELDQCIKDGIYVHSFEPNPHIYEVLQEKYGDSELCTINNSAAWSCNETRYLYAKKNFKDLNGGSSLYYRKTNINELPNH